MKPTVGGGVGGGALRLFLLLTTFLTLTFIITNSGDRSPPSTAADGGDPILTLLTATAVHYAAAASSNHSGGMTAAEMAAVVEILRKCSTPCNLLVFGITAEAELWRGVNGGGRTIFIDGDEYKVAKYERENPGVEAYDVGYSTRVDRLPELVAAAKAAAAGECRPVQNLMYSECEVGINEMPSHVYEVGWDVIIVDGPRGDMAAAPGRTMSIFTAAVMARSGGGEGHRTNVVVHDVEREVERVCCEEFLCGEERMVKRVGNLAHFLVENESPEAEAAAVFCRRTR